jgi:hypothetical protein
LEVLKGKAKTVFSINCRKTCHGLLGVGCADIFHSTVPAATDILPIDVEMSISKIYLYLKSYTVKT